MRKSMTTQPTLATKVIDELGGTSQVARLMQISKASVSAWRKNGIPQAREMYFRVAYPKLEAWGNVKKSKKSKKCNLD